MCEIEKSTGNVYEDLGSENASEMLVKAQLAATLKDLIASRGITEIQASEAIGLSQPHLSHLLNGQFRDITVSRMLEMIASLGRDIQIVIGPESTRRSPARQGRVEVIQG